MANKTTSLDEVGRTNMSISLKLFLVALHRLLRKLKSGHRHEPPKAFLGPPEGPPEPTRGAHPRGPPEGPPGPPEGPKWVGPPEGPKWVGPRGAHVGPKWVGPRGAQVGGPTRGPSGWAQAGPKWAQARNLGPKKSQKFTGLRLCRRPLHDLIF